MKILYLTAYPPDRIRVRPFELLRVLNESGHEVKIATLAGSSGERAALHCLDSLGIEARCFRLGLVQKTKNGLHALASGLPLQYTYSFQPELWAWVRGELESGQVDLVHVEHLRAAVFAVRIRETFPDGPPVVWDAVDAISWLLDQARNRATSRLVRLVARFELERTRKCEAWLRDRFDAITVTSDEDRNVLARTPGKASISVVPNGVDSHYFCPDGDGHRQADTLVFSGKMSFHANVSAALHFIRNILPLVWETRPGVRFLIVGADPPGVLRRLARKVGRHRITVVGRVPDMRCYLRKATVAVAPLTYSVGVQNKVLEALSSGIPVVSSPCAVRALAACPGRDLLVAGDPPEFARSIERLLEDPQLREQMGAAGRRYAISHHSWQESGRKLMNVYRSVLSSGGQ